MGIAMQLVPTTQCPVCSCAQREPSDGMAIGRGHDLQGVHYLERAASTLGITVEQLVSAAQTYRCSCCGNFYCDPWLSPELSAALFCAGAPDHLFAWGAFESWLHRRPPGQTRNERLYIELIKRLGRIDTYAEFACPFQGFLMQWKGFEAAPRERLRSFSAALHRQPDVRWSTISRFYMRVQAALGRIAVLALRIRGVLVRLASVLHIYGKAVGNWQRPLLRIDAKGLPARRYLLTRDTSIGWGSNCVRYGASCRYFAHTVLGAEVLPLHEAVGRGTLRFDVIGVFNSLDHTYDPLAVIQEAFRITNHVLLVTHQAKHAGKQHWFAFSGSFADWLNATLPGVQAETLISEADPGEQESNYILLSRIDGER